MIQKVYEARIFCVIFSWTKCIIGSAAGQAIGYLLIQESSFNNLLLLHNYFNQNHQLSVTTLTVQIISTHSEEYFKSTENILEFSPLKISFNMFS